MKTLFIEIYNYGKYYNPAYLHYATEEFIVNVHCNRCLKPDLKACIGWNDSDLCMRCVADIDDYINCYEIIEEVTLCEDSIDSDKEN